VIVDNEIHNYDIHEIIGYSDNEIIGYTIEGVLIRVDTTTSDEVCYEPFKNECKTFELTLCNERCWCRCQDMDEEELYAKIFAYLESCPQFNHIDELITYLIKQCIEKLPSYEAARGVCVALHSGCQFDDDSHPHSVRFEKVFALAEILVYEEE